MKSLVTFVLADELIFTNKNQLDYMLSLYEDQKLIQLVRSKAVVRQQPMPPASAYGLVESGYRVPVDTVNIAYFGSFYKNRGLDDVFHALMNLPRAVRAAVRLHIFSNRPAEVTEAVRAYGLGPNVYSNPYLSYMDFLSATQLFDVLLVNDVERGLGLPVNPFFPSKYSDYLGSGRKIFALVDDGSTLSTMETDYKAPVGNVPLVIEQLQKIVADVERVSLR